MKKQVIIRIMTLVIIITAAVFMVSSAARTARLAQKEECIQGDNECMEAKSQSEFLLESLTKNLLGR